MVQVLGLEFEILRQYLFIQIFNWWWLQNFCVMFVPDEYYVRQVCWLDVEVFCIASFVCTVFQLILFSVVVTISLNDFK